MKMIFQIAKTELRNLFYSPVAWFLAIVFLVQCAIIYTNLTSSLARMQAINFENSPDFVDFGFSLTRMLVISVSQSVLRNLYLFIPLLTMGLMSREINNGTVKLLYSSPIKLRQIVLGKYLAIMIYNVILLLLLGIFFGSVLIDVRSADYGLILAGLLGFYLMVCAYTAIGFFMSSLTTYQIVSAIGSFVVLLVLSSIGNLWQKYDFVRDLTYFLSVDGRAEKMTLKGLVTTKDIIYFAVVVYMFLGFTLLKLRAARELKPWYVKAGRYLGVFASALTIGYISSRPALIGYWDASTGKINTIDLQTQKLLKDMGDEPLEVTLYTNIIGGNAVQGFPEKRNAYLTNMWENYVRFKPGISFKYEYYYDYNPGEDSSLFKQYPKKTLKEIASITAQLNETDFSRYVSGEEMHKKIDLKPEDYWLTMQLKYKGRTQILRTFPPFPHWPQEATTAAAFKRLVQNKWPKLYYLTGNLERSIYKLGEREYAHHSSVKRSEGTLVNNGFDVDSLNLDTQEMPADIAGLIIADPKVLLSAATLDKVKQYIDKGGNLLINGEPGKQQVLNPLLAQLGVRLLDGQLAQPSYDETPEKITPRYITENMSPLSKGMNAFLKEVIVKESDTIGLLMAGATGIAYTSDSNAFTIKPLAISVTPRAWLKAGAMVIDSTAPVFSPQEGDRMEPFPTALSLTRQVNNREQRIIVCSDADFMIPQRLITANAAFLSTIYSWLNYAEYPIYIPQYKPKDTLVTLSRNGAAVQKIVYVWVLPAALLLIGTILLIRRKRK